MKLCKDCKNHIEHYSQYDENPTLQHQCKRGRYLRNPVIGKVTYLTDCAYMRENACGEDAKLFEPSTWYKIKTFFRKETH